MTVLFSSDLHFNHKRIIELSKRYKVTTSENHTEWLIDLWNSQVKPSDIIWHLGDFNFSRNIEDWTKVLNKLNGNKFFIKGNHDSSDILKKLSKDNKIVWYDYKEVKTDLAHLILFHFPIGSWNRQHYGSWHLHGHSHGNYTETKGKMLDVGLDSAYNIYGEHKFFTLEDIHAIMQTKQIYTTDHYREAIE